MKKHLSFFNIELLDSIISDLGTVDDKTRLKEYKCQLHMFCKRHVFEIPHGSLGGEPNGDEWTTLSISILLSEKAFNNIASLNDIESSKVEIATILGILPSKLHLYKIEKGCIILHFTVQTSVVRTIFPLRLGQLAQLRSQGFLINTIKLESVSKNNLKEVPVIVHRDIYRLEFECPICLSIVCDPQVISCCNRNICLLCCESITKCCLCHSTDFILIPNRKVQWLLEALHVPCIHAHSGCKWIGKLSNFQKHMEWSAIRDFKLTGCQLFLLSQQEQCM